jgi:hypothetical protein
MLLVDQTPNNPGFGFLRKDMKPTLAKPRSIIVHVEGSGTAVTAATVHASGYVTPGGLWN